MLNMNKIKELADEGSIEQHLSENNLGIVGVIFAVGGIKFTAQYSDQIDGVYAVKTASDDDDETVLNAVKSAVTREPTAVETEAFLNEVLSV